MYRSPHTIVHRDLAFDRMLRARGTDDVVALTEATNELQGLNFPRASKVRHVDPSRVAYPFLPGRLDYKLDAAVTRTRRAAKDPLTIDRMSSELYPEVPPRIDFVVGLNTRFNGRDPVVLVA